MTLICYVDKNFGSDRLALIDKANEILAEYEDDGYTLTLRQLYYQFVARDIIPNTERSYKNLGNLISDARYAGLVSWHAIEDRGRTTHTPYVQDDVSGTLENIEYSYALDYWANQPRYVEVWIEKDALVNVIERPARRYRVPHLACKGYVSSSELWRAGQRFAEAQDAGKECILLHLGDHDPSGIDMTRDNGDRLDLFGAYVEVRRLALNRDQVDRYDPPPNPAKVSDTRAAEYIARHGNTSWELDALQPSVIATLVADEIKSLIDFELWNAVKSEEDENREALRYISNHAEEALEWASDRGAE